MRPLSVRNIRTIIDGILVHGSDDIIVENGAYYLKQIKKPNTLFFSKSTIANWDELIKYSPLVLVTCNQLNLNVKLEDVTIIKVKDTYEAYWKFVDEYRSMFKIPVVAITGTSGKTTTKEMVSHILSSEKTITSTDRSNNSRTAHLQYLLNIDDDTEAAVFEAAVGAPGDVLRAGTYFKPTIGIITNIGSHHLNYCRTQEAYINAKGEMAKILDESGVLILNSDDKNSKKINLQHFRGRVITFGKRQSSNFRATNIKYCNDGMRFNVRYNNEIYPVYIPVLGEHQVYNALAALAAVNEMGYDLSRAAGRLKTFQNLNKHIQLLKGLNGSILLDDTWSITTTSLEAALKVLNEVGKNKKRVAILGTITDLGSWGYVIHEQAGEIISKQGVDVLITVGMHARIMADRAVKSGLISEVYSFNNNILVYDLLKKIVDENTVVLIKGDMYSKPIFELAAKLRMKD
ncbi:UDP-N-acetylmuramoyl-tripeptide--D-alanyl-D-alanine ligase [Bacillus sp. FJAT-49736]|nr:UDP-N-acetylmuramoyl-tripeptide--D-alanyl-D-alanine ligase [Bacillus sp. FJAT-49736]